MVPPFAGDRDKGYHPIALRGTPLALCSGTRTAAQQARFRISPLVAVLAAILLILIVPPAWYLIQASFQTTKPDGSFDQFTLRYYQQLFTSPYFASSLWNTVLYAIGAAAVAITLGLIQALIVERTNTPGRKYVFFGAVISLGVRARRTAERADRDITRVARRGPRAQCVFPVGDGAD
jgi:hypothetical protein